MGWGGLGWDVNVHVHVTLMMLRWSWGGVGWDVDVHVHVTLMILHWSWGGVGRDVTVHVHVTLMMLRWSWGGGVGLHVNVHVHVTLMMLRWPWGGVGWNANVHVHVTLMMLRWSWGGVGWDVNVHVHVTLKLFHGWSSFWEVKKTGVRGCMRSCIGKCTQTPLKPPGASQRRSQLVWYSLVSSYMFTSNPIPAGLSAARPRHCKDCIGTCGWRLGITG